MAIGEREPRLFFWAETIDVSLHRKLRELRIIKDGERLSLLDPPISHPRSKAKYSLEEFPIGSDLGYGYELGRGDSTSRHYHLIEYDVWEEYHWVDGGEQKVVLAGVEHVLSREHPYVLVPPGVVHQSFVPVSFPPVRTFVRMRNGLLVPKEKRHIPVPETTWNVI